MGTPSDADRATGLRITQTVHGGLMPDAIAQALADERERMRAAIDAEVRKHTFERGGLWFVQNTAVYDATRRAAEDPS